MQTKRLPIGYYLKLADNCLTNGIDEIQFKHGMERVEWQVLNSIHEKPAIRKDEIRGLMKPFASNQLVEDILLMLINKNEVENENNKLTLTTSGKDLHKSCFDAQLEFRNKAIAGISETAYQTTILTLQKMINNLS